MLVRFLIYCLAIPLTLGVIPCGAQMEPDAPVRNFILPQFGEDGYRVWSLRGRRGIYVDSTRIDVEGVQLRIFKKGEPGKLNIQIESPQASIHTQENRATGPGTILVIGPTFSVTGQDWEWSGEQETVIVKQNARVTFSENLTDILR